MVDAQKFKQRIESALSQEYKIEFLGNNFDEIVNLFTETRSEKIYAWLKEVVEKNVQPIVTGSKEN